MALLAADRGDHTSPKHRLSQGIEAFNLSLWRHHKPCIEPRWNPWRSVISNPRVRLFADLRSRIHQQSFTNAPRWPSGYPKAAALPDEAREHGLAHSCAEAFVDRLFLLDHWRKIWSNNLLEWFDVAPRAALHKGPHQAPHRCGRLASQRPKITRLLGATQLELGQLERLWMASTVNMAASSMHRGFKGWICSFRITIGSNPVQKRITD